MIFNNSDVLRELNLLPFWLEKEHTLKESNDILKEGAVENLLLIYKFSNSSKDLNIIIDQNELNQKPAKSLMENLVFYLKSQFENFELKRVSSDKFSLDKSHINIVLGGLMLSKHNEELIKHASLAEMIDNYSLKKKLLNELKVFFNYEN
jgi:hypothetical protein